jgi:ketosteroid isomerase-like protein
MHYVLIQGPSYRDLNFEAREEVREKLRENLEAQGIRFLQYDWVWDEEDRCLLLVGQYEKAEDARYWIDALESMGFTVFVRTQLPGEEKEGVTVLSREEIEKALAGWNKAWDKHDLEGVMELFHDDVLFDNFTGGRVQGKEKLRKAWGPWFASHGDFKFTEEETFIDEKEQKAGYRWQFDWPSQEKGYEGKPETRRGVDVLHFKDGKIIKKLTYSKTSLEIDGKKVKLIPDTK